MSRIVLLFPTAFLVSVAGCGETPISRTGTVRDSAGIVIVDNADPIWSEVDAWSLSESPTLVIGVSEGDSDYELFQIASAARLSDGRVVVASNGTHDLRYYSADGRHLRSVGREGGGPGEFRTLVSLAKLASDSLLVYDLALRRISIFDSEGEHCRDVSFATGGQLFMPIVVGRLSDGSFLAHMANRQFAPGDSEFSTGEIRDSIITLRISPQGDILDTLGVFPNMKMQVQTRNFGGERVPFPATTPFRRKRLWQQRRVILWLVQVTHMNCASTLSMAPSRGSCVERPHRCQ